jgi:hypothetical protein
VEKQPVYHRSGKKRCRRHLEEKDRHRRQSLQQEARDSAAILPQTVFRVNQKITRKEN